ncbi:hypothetical protein H5186_03375 [Pseudoalteromonas sp. SG41-2]|uniref:UvrD-helicase domain-containing protein n=1 Tax=Pseudoalteromonas sp. SG41-2 TaxID=2760978 RepID=UPI001600B962|nr:UvrD-helicase domain-containing protein [Pseudoalteromonas sp. SG41-2]MBB1478505.1 hypothetical protein [Pseudoalteromonas sp. SG41-2]
MIKTLIIDEETVNVLSYASIKPLWFTDYQIPLSLEQRIKRVQISDKLFLISEKTTSESKLLVIKVNSNGIFSELDNKDKSIAFDRVITIALSQFGESISPGKGWGRYVSGKKLSIYATKRTQKNKNRLYFDTSPIDTNHIFAYALDSNNNGFENIEVDESLFLDSVTLIDEAINSSWQNTVEADDKTQYGIELTEDLYRSFGECLNFEQWYENKLTNEQRSFVDKSYDEPVRLKGAAGTGKTLALAVKILKDAYRFETEKKQKRLLFVTHSFVTAQLVEDMLNSMDSEMNWKFLEHVKIKIVSLYDLAQELLNYNLKKFTPISKDGKEGRKLQFEILEEVLTKKLLEAKFKVGVLGKCGDNFKSAMESKESRKPLLLEILNEFACVLDAENIVMGSDNGDKYLTSSRENWQMHLPTEHERRAVLELHMGFRKYLKDLNVLSMDQMIADLNRYLMSHEWNHICEDEGYDGVFVDELHCFTRPERMVFHELFRLNKSFETKKLPLFMAYDIKQSVDDNFICTVKKGSGSALINSTNVGKTNLVELTQVFRYTPEIAKFLSDLDGSFPALDLASEWSELTLKTNTPSGAIPKLSLYSDPVDLIDNVFKLASRQARSLSGKKTVAILCSNFDLFEEYLIAGRIKKYYEPISSRDDVTKLGRLKGKCIFSMPEYVAGLQFDMVYLINLDKVEVDEDNPSCGAYRRFVSRVYLGASRAKEELHISACESRQGYSPILQPALSSNSLLMS